MVVAPLRGSASRIRPVGGAAVSAVLLVLSLAACGGQAATPAAAPPLPVTTEAQDGSPAPETGTASSGASQVPPVSVALQGAEPAPVGLSDVGDDGALVVPEDISELGWWVGSSPMGASRGTTLIAGHVDSKVAGLGVFAQLNEMDEGDRITVVDGLGKQWQFAVSSTEQVTKSKLPAGLFDTAGRRRLALITCGGPFNSQLRSYRDNLIVYADPV